MKYIFITGGVVSSLGKGIAAASIGLLLKQRGLRVAIQKFDPYLNVDPGTMSPFQHGEVFVTDDGGETDLDLGHYERFLDQSLTRDNSVTAGKVYQAVIERERAGGYLGKTVQVVPHVTDEIKTRVRAAGEKGEVDVIITEIGGTTGDIESLPFLEACRQMRHEEGARQLPLHPPGAGAVHQGRARDQDQAHPAQRQGPAARSASSPTSSCAAPRCRWARTSAARSRSSATCESAR